MGTYDITVCQTLDSYDDDGTDPLIRVKDYIEGNFGNLADSVTVNVYAPARDDFPNPPTENYKDSNNDDTICGTYYDYEWLTSWFKTWGNCNLPDSYVAADCNVLLTNSDNDGGAAIHSGGDDGTGWAVVEADDVASANSSYTRYSKSDGHDHMQTVMHEIGHVMLDPDYSYPESGHTTGAVTKTVNGTFSDWHYVTPMGLGGTSNTDNYCNDGPYDRPGTRYWDVMWSDCNYSYWSSPGKN